MSRLISDYLKFGGVIEMKHRIAFLGSKSTGFEVLKNIYKNGSRDDFLVIHPDDRKDKRSCLNKFESFIQNHDRIILETASSMEKARTILSDYKMDICFVSGWYWLLTESDLKLSPQGYYGIHPSLLPKYRGNAPLVWQIINGESEIGASLFQFQSGMDDGDVYHHWTFPLKDSDSIADVILRFNKIMAMDIGPLSRKIINETL